MSTLIFSDDFSTHTPSSALAGSVASGTGGTGQTWGAVGSLFNISSDGAGLVMTGSSDVGAALPVVAPSNDFTIGMGVRILGGGTLVGWGLKIGSAFYYLVGNPPVFEYYGDINGTGSTSVGDYSAGDHFLAIQVVAGVATVYWNGSAVIGGLVVDAVSAAGLPIYLWNWGVFGSTPTAIVFTSLQVVNDGVAAATTYTRSAGFPTRAGIPMAIKVKPNGVYTGTITVTPNSNCGLTAANAVTLTFSNSAAEKTATFYPTSTGTVTFTFTNNQTLTDPATLAVTVGVSDAHIQTAEPDLRRITSASKISVLGSHPKGVTSMTLTDGASYTTTQTTQTINPTWANNSDVAGRKHAGAHGFTFDISPTNFFSSGVKTLTPSTVNADGSTTTGSAFQVFIDKGDITGELASISGSQKISDASHAFGNTNHATINLGAAAGNGYDFANAGSIVANTTGYTYIQRTSGTTRSQAIIATSSGYPATPRKTWFMGIQFGTGDPLVAVLPEHIGDNDSTTVDVIQSGLWQGPLEGAPYYGCEWKSPDGQLQVQINSRNFINCGLQNLQAVRSASVAIGFKSKHTTYGWQYGPVFINCEEQHVFGNIDPTDFLPTPGTAPADNIHADLMFGYGGEDTKYIKGYRAILGSVEGSGSWSCRGFHFAQDGRVRKQLTIEDTYMGTFAEPLDNEALSISAQQTVLNRGVVTGAFSLVQTFNGVGNLSITASTHTLTAATGDFANNGVIAGDMILLSGFTNAANNGLITVVSVSGGSLVYTTTHTDVDEGPVAATATLQLLPPMCTDWMFRDNSGTIYEPAGTVQTFTGTPMFLVCWPNASLTFELPRVSTDVIVVTDHTKFTCSGIVITAVAETNGQFAITYTGTIYAGQTPTLSIAVGGYTINGTNNPQKYVTMLIGDNYSTTPATPVGSHLCLDTSLSL